MAPRRKHTFLLKINQQAVELKFGFNLVSNLQVIPNLMTTAVDTPEHTTSLSDLPCAKEKNRENTFSYLDESKQSHRCQVTMTGLLDTSMPKVTKMCCFWCRNSFSHPPVGLPVRYVPSRITKTYHSEITKDGYCITDNITMSRYASVGTLAESQMSEYDLSHDHPEYFIVDGVFCSFNCASAFAHECRKDPKYTASMNLLTQLYTKAFGRAPPVGGIERAPSWRLLKDYGGPMSIEEFRSSFSCVKYDDINDHVYIPPVGPYVSTVGRLFERRMTML